MTVLRTRVIVLIVMALIATVTASFPVAAASDTKFREAGQNGVRDAYIVVLKTSASGADAVRKRLLARYPGVLRHVYRSALAGFSVTMPKAVAAELSRDPDVALVEQDAWGAGGTTQVSPPSWGLDRVDERNLPWDTQYSYWTTGVGSHAYVLDSGVRSTHADFGGRATMDADFVGDGQNGNDCHGHGTHVAGTVGGTAYGVAKGVRLHSVRVLNCSNLLAWSWLIAALDWVRANARRPAVVNMSLWGTPSTAVDTAVNNVIQAGIPVVTIAGNNSGGNACAYSPSRVPTALTVANSTSADARSTTSNIGSCVDLFAPGTNIVSAGIATDTASTVMSGTSMAAPHVTGTVARLLQRNPAATPAQITTTILAEATRDVITDAGTGTPNLLLFSDLAMTSQQVVTGSFTVNPNEGWDVLVPCPTGTVVTGGGYSHGSTLAVEIDSSAPRPTGWYVHALNGGSQPRTITAYAVCARIAGQQVVTTSYTIPPGWVKNVNAQCPGDKRVVGGGFFHDSTFGFALNASVPQAGSRIWHVEAVNGHDHGRVASSSVVCAAATGLEMVSTAFSVQPGQGWDTVARCPAGTAVTGGGYYFAPPDATYVSPVAIDISAPHPSNGWHVHAFNGGSIGQSIIAYAMCAAAR